MIVEFIARTGVYTPYENSESAAYLEVYRFPKDFVNHIEEDYVSTDTVMEELGFSNQRGFVEPGAWYTEYNFVALNRITEILVIEVQESLNV